MSQLEGKVVLITGGGRGIGRATSLLLAKEGADLVIISRTKKELHQVSQQINHMGRRVKYYEADVSKLSEIDFCVAQTLSSMGKIDILVNNAGLNIPELPLEVTEASWDRIMGTNLKGAFFMSQAVGRAMISQGSGGRIINISSQAGSVALPKRAAYCASKAGLNLITKTLAVDWAQFGILVNAVAPTFVETEFTKDALSDLNFRNYALSKNVLKKFATEEDIANAILFLATEASRMITGHVLMIDGGWTAH